MIKQCVAHYLISFLDVLFPLASLRTAELEEPLRFFPEPEPLERRLCTISEVRACVNGLRV